MRALIVAVLLAWPAFAHAQAAAPRSIDDCEAIKGDLAYNQCLAMFGPRAGSRPPQVGPGGDPESVTPAQTRSRFSARRGRAFRGRQAASRSRRGRQVMSFDVRSSRATTAAPRAKRFNRRRR